MQFPTFLFSLLSFAVIVQGQVEPAPQCTEAAREQCKLPQCRCSGIDIPGGLTAARTPQLVHLTFDDAVQSENYPFYKELFGNRVNPNGQPITGSFYINHEYTNYSQVHDLWRSGHEIALHSITHTPQTGYWRDMNESMWIMEIVQQREQMANFARIPASDIKGIRAPFLQTGADRMYKVLKDASFQYESSMPSQQRRPGLWPYTNDYASTQDCQIPPCRIGKYDGFWTSPMVDLVGDNFSPCSMVDTCLPVPETEESTYDLLMRNFNDHYTGNKSPFGLYVHAAWINGTGDGDEDEKIQQRRIGYERFVDHILSLGDVYIVSVTRGIEWVKNPQDINNVATFPHFQVTQKPNLCPLNYACPYRNPERWLHSCVTCPPVYPWLGNHLGRNPRNF